MKAILALISLAVLQFPIAFAEDVVPAEIDYLLSAVGNSECVFVRNGKRHDAKNAESHLRMKYRRGKRYAPTTEAFIERLASKSSMSKKLYRIDCPGAQSMPSGEWLTLRLAEYRAPEE